MSNTRFEYLVHEVKNDFFKGVPNLPTLSEDLNRLGGQGWELVTPLQLPTKFAFSTQFVFKRAR